MTSPITATFTITISRQNNGYTIAAAGPQGMQVEPQSFPARQAVLTAEQEASLVQIAARTFVSPEAVQSLGHALYQAIFTIPNLAHAFYRAQGLAEANQGRLRLRLEIEPPELASLPWEAMHDGQDWLLRQNIVLVRRFAPESAAPTLEQLAVSGPLHILFVGASPLDQTAGVLDIEAMLQNFQMSTLLQKAIADKRVVFDFLLNASPEDLRNQLAQAYHILYFAAHGSPQGLYLDDGCGEVAEVEGRLTRGPSDGSEIISAEALVELLKEKEQPTRLVFLAACKTATLLGETEESPAYLQELLVQSFAEKVARGANLPAIVAMQFSVNDLKANELAASFFASLAAFNPVDMALAEAREAMLADSGMERDVISPVMYLQAEDGALFKQARNWFKISLIALAPVLLVLGILLYLAWQAIEFEQLKKAQNNSFSLARQSQFFTAQSPPLSLLLGIEALTTTIRENGTHLPIAEQALRDTFTQLGGWALIGHKDSVNVVAFSAEGSWLATASNDTTVRLWQVNESGAELVTVLEHEVAVQAATFSKNGDWLATGSAEGNVSLWNLTNLKSEPIMSNAQVTAHNIAFSPDNRWLAVAGNDNAVWLWNLNDLSREPVILTGHKDRINAVIFSPDSHWLATASNDKTVRLWNVSNSNPEYISLNHTSWVTALAFSPDSSRLATADFSGIVYLWPTKNPATKGDILEGHQSQVNALAFSQDGQWLVTGSTDNTARLWDVSGDTSKLVNAFNHEGSVAAVMFSPNDRWIATASQDKTVRLWRVEDPLAKPIILRGHEDGVNSIAFNPNNHWLASASSDSSVRLWDVDTLSIEPIILNFHQQAVFDVDSTQDGQWLATGSADQTIRLWNINHPADSVITLTQNASVKNVTFSPDDHWLATAGADSGVQLWNIALPKIEHPILLPHETPVNAITFSPNGRWLATAGRDGVARLWRLDNPTTEPVTLRGSNSWVNTVAFSYNNHWLAMGEAYPVENTVSSVYLWNLDDLEAEPIILYGHQGSINLVLFSQDNRWLASASDDATVRLWDLNNLGNSVFSLKHNRRVSTMAFSSDNRWLATGSNDATIHLWDLKKSDPSAQPVVFKGHHATINVVAFAPDNRRLATASVDNTIRLWDIDDLSAESIILRGHKQAVLDMMFSRDGRWLVTTSADSTIRLWRMKLKEDLIPLACSVAGRNLTVEEAEFLPGEDYTLTCPNLPIHPTFTKIGEELAKKDDIEGAVEQFEKVQRLDQKLNFDSKGEALRIANQAETERQAGLQELVGKGNTRLRFMHTSLGAPNVDIYIDNLLIFSNVPFATITEYQAIAPGLHRLKVLPTGVSSTSPAVVEGGLTSSESGDYSLFLMGHPLSSLGLQNYMEDNTSSLSIGSFGLRAINASSSLPGIDICLDGQEEKCAVMNLGFKNMTGVVAGDAGIYNIYIRQSGTDKIILRVPNVNLEDGQIYSAVVMDLVEGTPNLKILRNTAVDFPSP